MGEPLKFDYYYGMEAERFSFYRVPRLLIKDERFKGLSSDAKLLYGLMLDRMSLSMKNGWLDDENRAYIIYTIDNMMEDLGCARATCVKVIKEFDSDNGIGLIEKKRRGLGKPDIIYVKNFAAVSDKKQEETAVNADKITEVQNLNFKALATGNPYIKEKMDLDIQVSKLKLMRANHTSQKYKLEDNIAKHYPQQIAILKERISGMEADIQTAKANLPRTGVSVADKEQFLMKVGDKFYTDKKEAGAALVEYVKSMKFGEFHTSEMKMVNVPATVGEYAGFQMAVSFDSLNHKFVMNIKGQLSHNLEIGSDPLGNIVRINHAIESMPKQLAEAQTKLETVERQLETAKVEVTKPFAQEAELAEKLERLSALNALLNMDEKDHDVLGIDDAPEKENEDQTSGHSVQKPGQEETIFERLETGEKTTDTPIPYPVENARHNDTVENGNPQGFKLVAAMADKPVRRTSLKEKLEAFKVRAVGAGKPEIGKVKGKEETR